MLSECQTAWIWMRRPVTRRLIQILVVCIRHYSCAWRQVGGLSNHSSFYKWFYCYRYSILQMLWLHWKHQEELSHVIWLRLREIIILYNMLTVCICYSYSNNIKRAHKVPIWSDSALIVILHNLRKIASQEFFFSYSIFSNERFLFLRYIPVFYFNFFYIDIIQKDLHLNLSE